MILRNIETCILRGYKLQSFIFLYSESIPYFWRQRILYGTWCFFDRLQLFVEINSTDDNFTVVKIINQWFLGILWYAKYDGKSRGSLFSLPVFNFLDFDVKHTLEEKVTTFQLYEISLFQSFEIGIASVHLTYSEKAVVKFLTFNSHYLSNTNIFWGIEKLNIWTSLNTFHSDVTYNWCLRHQM